VPRPKPLSAAECDKLTLLSVVELFSTLIDDDMNYVASRTGFRSVPAGTEIFSEGETANQFFIVTSGSVTVTSDTRGTETVELARYLPGDVFGDFHFVISGTYDGTAAATEKTELLVFPEDGFSFDRLADEKPDTASRILLRSISMIETRIRSTRTLIGENAPWVRALRKQIYTDPPTALWNKYFMDTELPQQLSGTVTVVMVKPDKFKEINDSLGHVAGDDILRKIATLLIARAREKKGWAVRLRSNEMCLIVPESDTTIGRSLARDIHARFPDMLPEDAFPPGSPDAFPLTASVGLGFWPDDHESWKYVTEKTNEIMQNVWKTGGNRIALLRESGKDLDSGREAGR
jgi:diguanylate cyclase (GGDEF)-like protein